MRLKLFLEKQGVWSQALEQDLREAIRQEHETAIKQVEAAGKAPLEWMFEDVFAEMTTHLQEQKESLLGS